MVSLWGNGLPWVFQRRNGVIYNIYCINVEKNADLMAKNLKGGDDTMETTYL